MHNQYLNNDNIKPALLDMLDIIAGRDELPTDNNKEPLPLLDKNGNSNIKNRLY